MKRFALVVLVCALATAAFAAKKKKKEDETQTLQLPKELPSAVIGETRRLTFHVTPLSAKGLLSVQVRDALKALPRVTRNQQILKLRAFVAGTGDMRRVRDLVSETFTERRQPLPVLSLVHAGGLPLEGAQVVLEAVAVAKKEVNPHGLAFLSARVATSPGPLDPVEPLTRKSLEGLRAAVKSVGAAPADVLRVTCFVSSLDRWVESRKMVGAEYPKAAFNLVQTQRAPSQALSACEAVARLGSAPAVPLEVRGSGEGASAAALVGAPRVVLTGTQVAFGFQERDANLAFGRLLKAVEQAGGSQRQVAWTSYYALSGRIAAQIRKLRASHFDREKPPAGSLLLFESLPSRDAGFAIDAVAVKE